MNTDTLASMRNRSGPLITCIDNTGRSLTEEIVPVDWHGLPVQQINSPDHKATRGALIKSVFRCASDIVLDVLHHTDS